jgi:hypothetical protein
LESTTQKTTGDFFIGIGLIFDNRFCVTLKEKLYFPLKTSGGSLAENTFFVGNFLFYSTFLFQFLGSFRGYSPWIHL